MPQKIYIVGGDGFARECLTYVEGLTYRGQDVTFGGFLGHNGYQIDFGPLSKHFISDLSEFTFGEDDYCVIGAGYPQLRCTIYHDIKKSGGKLFNLVFDTYIPDGMQIGEGNIILHSFVSTAVAMGNGNLLNWDVIVAHDVRMGDFNFFGPRSQALGGVSMGNHNQIGASSVLLPHARLGDENIVAPLSAVYKGCKNHCYMLGNPALNVK